MSLSRQSITLVLTTKNNQTQHYIHQKHKRKTALANKTTYTLIWYAFYDLRSGNGVGPILTAPEPTEDSQSQYNNKVCIVVSLETSGVQASQTQAGHYSPSPICTE